MGKRSTHVREHPRRTKSGKVTDVTDHDRSLKDTVKPKKLEPKRKKRIDLGGLSAAAVEVKSQYFDFSKGYTETWDYIEADECGECGKLLVCRGEERHKYLEDSDCEGYVLCEGPMMNYRYPLPYFDQDTGEAAKKIAHLPLCVVEDLDAYDDENRYYLALSGGGMNYSWEICMAYIDLGYLPPAHFCRLPRMAGKRPTPENLKVVAACKKSLQLKSEWSQGDTRELDGIEKTWEEKGSL
jgi:hypothetical protein